LTAYKTLLIHIQLFLSSHCLFPSSTFSPYVQLFAPAYSTANPSRLFCFFYLIHLITFNYFQSIHLTSVVLFYYSHLVLFIIHLILLLLRSLTDMYVFSIHQPLTLLYCIIDGCLFLISDLTVDKHNLSFIYMSHMYRSDCCYYYFIISLIVIRFII
jgi:hypothetical protein